MAVFQHILLTIAPVFLVITLGFGLKKTGLFTASFVSQLNKLVFYVALPSLLFYEIGTADFGQSFNGTLLTGLVAGMILTFGASYLYGRLRHYSPARQGAFCQGAFRGNLAYIGLAISYYVYGDAGLATAGILIGFLVPCYNFLAVMALVLPHDDAEHSFTKAFWLYQVAFNPLILASFVGVIWSLTGFSLPQVVEKTLQIVTGMSLPLALFSIGATFSFAKLKGDMVVAGLATATKLILAPLITLACLLLLGVGGDDLGLAFILAGAPTATAAYIMADQLQGDSELTGSIIMLTTLLSLVTYTLGLSLLRWLSVY